MWVQVSYWRLLFCLVVILTLLDTSTCQMSWFGGGSRGVSIRPIAFRLPNPPVLIGPLKANELLAKAEKLHQNLIKGPSSFVNHEGSIYAATIDNKIYDIVSCPPRLVAVVSPQGCNSIGTCGILTSLRLDPGTGDLLALVNSVGLVRVNTTTGNQTLVFSAKTPVNGRAPVYLTDFVVTSDGTIVMADGSDTFAYPNDIYICMDSKPTGRLVAFNPTTRRVMEILPNTFVNPSSLELSAGGDLLVSEACRARIRRVSLKPASLLAVSDFVNNLPGTPDNIRITDRGTYWVALRYSRHTSLRRNTMDQNAGNPAYRTMGARYMSRQQLERMMSSWTIVVEISEKGEYIQSLHDPSANVFPTTTEVQEINGVLYIGSDKTSYVGRIILPEVGGRKINIDSYIQVLRSRCQLQDKDVEATRGMLLERYPHLV